MPGFAALSAVCVCSGSGVKRCVVLGGASLSLPVGTRRYDEGTCMYFLLVVTLQSPRLRLFLCWMRL